MYKYNEFLHANNVKVLISRHKFLKLKISFLILQNQMIQIHNCIKRRKHKNQNIKKK